MEKQLNAKDYVITGKEALRAILKIASESQGVWVPFSAANTTSSILVAGNVEDCYSSSGMQQVQLF